MAKYRKKPIVIEATQWFRNGDHPLDYVKDHVSADGPMVVTPGHVRKAEGWEGDVVRYFRRPQGPGIIKPCDHCGQIMHVHGWIDTKEGGHIVCPGDWIITGVEGEVYPCKPSIFEATYEIVE